MINPRGLDRCRVTLRSSRWSSSPLSLPRFSSSLSLLVVSFISLANKGWREVAVLWNTYGVSHNYDQQSFLPLLASVWRLVDYWLLTWKALQTNLFAFRLLSEASSKVVVCTNLVVSSSICLVLSRSNYPYNFVYDYAWVIFSSDRWKIERSWFPLTREDLGNRVNRDIAPRVCHCLEDATLKVRVLGRVRWDEVINLG